MFQGESIKVLSLGDGFAELCFDRQDEAINKLDDRTVREFGQASAVLAATPGLRGVLVTSAKDVFIVGADITEFGAMFKHAAHAIRDEVLAKNQHFVDFEDLPLPSVVAINGFALGGGLELALAGSLRVMSTAAQVGLPEVKLGLFPGFGGTVRMARVAGPATAIDWVIGAKPASAQAALAAGVVDEICALSDLREQALALLRRAADGDVDWQARQERKRQPVPLAIEALQSIFEPAIQKAAVSSAKHQPAALMAVQMMQTACSLERAEALRLEAEAFGRVAKTQAAGSLVQTFLSEQVLKKLFKKHAAAARPIKQGAVLGAGIMGGGIAYTSALRGVPVRLKDIAQNQLDLGIGEARKQLNKLVKSGRRTQEKADAFLASIVPQLDYAGFENVDVVVEAVVENIKLKHAVLSELENVVRTDAVIASNTSSLLIDDIVLPLKRQENFVGMHFFNPVLVMQLVEIIQGSKTSDQAVSTAVGYAVTMGKTPIVVKDCPGFLVNRILTAYIRGFLQLINDGADFAQVDRVMEAFGWPMGPAYLEDVIGIDTGSHVNDIISSGYAERWPRLEQDALRLMLQHNRYGQKNGIGFYRYEIDPNGKPKRSVAGDSYALLAQLQPQGHREFSEQDIVERMMLPLIVESAHALEDGVVASPVELDMALLLGIGCPAYLGGALKYADWLGLAHVVARADHYAAILGEMYRPPERMRQMAAAAQTYY